MSRRKAPTAEEWERMGRAKAGPCMACLARHRAGRLDAEMVVVGCDYHHTKSGNIRRGHAHGFALCLWHHHGTQQLHALGVPAAEARELWGPSLHDEGRLFKQTYGSDDEMIEMQTRIIEGESWDG